MRNTVCDDLQYKGLKIHQYEDGYRFNSDSVLLANLSACRQSDIVADLGAGSGVISILFSAKKKPEKIYAVEIQKEYYDLLLKNVEENGLNDSIVPILSDMKEFAKENAGKFDVVLSNPPYSKISEGLVGDREDVAIARQEIKINLKEVVESAAKLLKYGGNFYVIYKAERLISLIQAMLKNNLTPKQIITVSPKEGIACDTVIVYAKKGGKTEGLKMENLIVYNEKGEYTKKIKALYDIKD